jgi:ubiquinone/menaquinone biosynthesis C-methylase UbiE
MQRIPEPELMDDLEQARAYSEADFAQPHEAFVRGFQERFPDFAGGRVLDLGCGPADVTLRFARAYPRATLLGIDAADAMLALGRARLEQAGVSHRVSLDCVRLPAPFSRRFDAVISNSLLHHLADPMVLWKTVTQTAMGGAPVFVMDLLRPASIEEAEALTATHASGAPAILRRDFFNSLLAAYRLDEIAAQLQRAQLQQLRVEQVSDRHVVVSGEA